MATLQQIDALTTDPVFLAMLRAQIGRQAEFIIANEAANTANHQTRVEAAGALMRSRSKLVSLAESMALRAAQNSDILEDYVANEQASDIAPSLIEFIVQYLWNDYAPAAVFT